MQAPQPILPGFAADPSVCRVGDDYYVATSTFSYFPGIAVHHSRDLVHWRPIGSALSRASQLNLDGLAVHAGIFAPTLRHHDGVFYLVTTLMREDADGGNFIVTATDPAGPWSEPVWIRDTPGFDPSLLFDDDLVWMCGTWQPDAVELPHKTEVWLQQLDATTLQLVGERHIIWRGASAEARWVEGPHVYRVDDGYLVLAAEGGTEWQHAVAVGRAVSITGPYVGAQHNPVLTTRHLGRSAPVAALGHADLVQTRAGDWWAVCHGVRPDASGWWGTGRESFLVPVTFSDDGWPLFGDLVDVGTSAGSASVPEHRWPVGPAVDGFDDSTLGPEWLMVRTPREQWWSLTDRDSHLRLRVRPVALSSRSNPSFVGRRVRQPAWAAYTSVVLGGDGDDAAAGLAIVAGDSAHLRLELTGATVRATLHVNGVETDCGRLVMDDGVVQLGMEADGAHVLCRAWTRAAGWRDVGTVDITPLDPWVTGWFCGLVVGMCAIGGGDGAYADFDWFSYADQRD